MSDRDEPIEPIESYWDFLAAVAHLQCQFGDDLVAWATAYEAGGRALNQSGRTLENLARQGARLERAIQAGPPGMVNQVMKMFAGPWPGMGLPASASPADLFTRFGESWAGAYGRPEPRSPSPSGAPFDEPA